MLVNKRIMMIAAYTVVLFVSAPQILGNAIITGNALLAYLSVCYFTLLLMDWYDKWQMKRSVSLS